MKLDIWLVLDIRFFELQCDARFEDGYLVIALAFVVGEAAACHFDDIVDEAVAQRLHALALYQRAGIEVYPAGLVVKEVGIGRYFHRGDVGAEGCAAACREEYHVATARSQSCSGHEVVAWGRE